MTQEGTNSSLFVSNVKLYPKQQLPRTIKSGDSYDSGATGVQLDARITEEKTSIIEKNVDHILSPKEKIENIVDLLLSMGQYMADIFNEVATKNSNLAANIILEVEAREPFAEDPGFVGYILLASISDQLARDKVLALVQSFAPNYAMRIQGDNMSSEESPFIAEYEEALKSPYREYREEKFHALFTKLKAIRSYFLAAYRVYKKARLIGDETAAEQIMERIAKLSPAVERYRQNMIGLARSLPYPFFRHSNRIHTPSKYSKVGAHASSNPLLYLKAFTDISFAHSYSLLDPKGVIAAISPRTVVSEKAVEAGEWYRKDLILDRYGEYITVLGIGWNIQLKLLEVKRLFNSERIEKIRKYADMYSVDPKLVATFILCEQRDQTIYEDVADLFGSLSTNTSVGLGQVLISTAKKRKLLEDKSYLPDWGWIIALRLENEDNNIKAVAKYIQILTLELRERYGRKPTLDEVAGFYTAKERASLMVGYKKLAIECYSDIEDSRLFD